MFVISSLHKMACSSRLKNFYKIFRLYSNVQLNTQGTDNTADLEKLIHSKKVPEGKDFRIRPPIVTIMGHVDHGKTTLLDALRHSEIVKQEFGGITQHIGAFVVCLDDKKTKQKYKIEELVTFLDTPGHAAFHAMRERGAQVTDIIILVVAADDGVMDQTVESIKFAKNAKVPIIVALNKIDKISNIDNAIQNIRQQLQNHDVFLEMDGGETQLVKLSALQGDGLIDLKEAILALAETLQLKAPYDGGVKGRVIESRLDPHRGKLSTILIESGSLTKGKIIVSGNSNFAKVRSMFDEWGNVVQSATPSFPVQVIGWRDGPLPQSGDSIIQYLNENTAKEIINAFNKLKNSQFMAEYEQDVKEKLSKQREEHRKLIEQYKENKIPFWKRKIKGPKQKMIQIDPDEHFKLRIIIKADVHGSLEAILDVLDTYIDDDSPVKINLIHYGIGNISLNDIDLASCFKDTIIFAFNVKTPTNVENVAKESNILIKKYNVIYHLIDEIRYQINLRQPEYDKEIVIGEATVQQEFLINVKKHKVSIAGSKCDKGVIRKSNECYFKLKRQLTTIHDKLEIVNLKHFKNYVNEVTKGSECGIMLKSSTNTPITYMKGDKIICFVYEKTKLKTKWRPSGF